MKIILSILAAGLFFSSQALAQNSQTYAAVCVNIESLTELVNEFDEAPSLTMNSYRERRNGTLAKIPTVLFINYETKSWTLVERVNDDRFCVIATGEDIKPYFEK